MNKGFPERTEVLYRGPAVGQKEETDAVFMAGGFSDSKAGPDYFRHITYNCHDEIIYCSEQHVVKAEGRKEQIMVAGKLSHGAYGQLNLAIRVALEEKILKSPSFFILDDVFIYSDKKRLERQFEVLSMPSGRDWFFLYFSAKQKVKQLDCKFSDNKIISMEG